VVVVGVCTALPLVACVPVQPPEAVQDVALVLDQVSVLVAPAVIAVGVAAKVTVGATAAVTVTEVDDCALPPAPVQASV
jgi:hypothetical protein